MLDRDVDAEPVGDTSVTPLVAAARRGHAAVVQLLITVGADIGAETRFLGMKKTCLAHAAGNGSPEIVSLLLERGDKLEAQ